MPKRKATTTSSALHKDTVSQTTKNQEPFQIWELPEVLLYNIASFIAPPTKRANFLCHSIAPLCKASHRVILEESHSKNLWDLVLKGDYGIDPHSHECQTRRSSKRLKRSPVDTVKEAQKLLVDNTEIAYFYLTELASTADKSKLTLKGLRDILQEFGPTLLYNRIQSTGGTFLVEVCAARDTTQATILKCVQELVEHRGAIINMRTDASPGAKLTALCVAAVRAMPNVVTYLLKNGALKDFQCRGQFRLSKNPRKFLRFKDSTALEAAIAMRDIEKENGATGEELCNLEKCIKLLR
jgi:hypothetical protein